MSEKWKEVYTKEQLEKLQNIEIRNLKELQRVCKIIGVEFFLYGGSLIGAVRHKGFIPWDDDLDIAFLRDDYEKFINEAPKHLSKEYFLQSPYTDKKSPYFYSKLRLKGTKYIEYGNHKLKMEQGIYVDIYPIDKLPNDDELFLKRYSKFQKYIKLFILRQRYFREEKSKTFKQKTKAIFRFCCSMCLKIIPHKCFVKKLDKIMKMENKNETNRYGNYSYFDPTNLFHKVTPYEKGFFEGIEVNLPNDWQFHLASRYGDFMEFPPEDKRIGHRPYILDFGQE